MVWDHCCRSWTGDKLVRNGSHDLPRWNKIIDLLIYTKWDNSVQQSHDSKKQCLWLQVLRCSWFLCVIPWTFCLVICSAVDADLTKQGDVEYLNCYSRIYLASLRTRMASVTLVSRIWRCMLSCRNPQRSVCHRRQIIHSGTQESNSIAPQVQQQPHGRRPVGTDESGNTLGSTDGVNFEVSSCNSSQKKINAAPGAVQWQKKVCWQSTSEGDVGYRKFYDSPLSNPVSWKTYVLPWLAMTLEHPTIMEVSFPFQNKCNFLI